MYKLIVTILYACIWNEDAMYITGRILILNITVMIIFSRAQLQSKTDSVYKASVRVKYNVEKPKLLNQVVRLLFPKVRSQTY